MTRSVLTLAVALGLASAVAWVASGLQLDTGLEALLPSDSVSVLSIQATRYVFLATALSTVLFAATLTIFGIDLHFYNLLAVPVVIGLGVSLAVNLIWLRAWCTAKQPAGA